MKMFLVALMTMVAMLIGQTAFASLSGGQMMVQEYTYNFATHGGAVGFIDISGTKKLPVGAVIMDVYYDVQTAFTSGGSATVSLGNATSNAKFLALTAYNNAAYTADTPAKAAIGVPAQVAVANDGKVGIAVAVAALTAGKMKMWLTVYVPKQ